MFVVEVVADLRAVAAFRRPGLWSRGHAKPISSKGRRDAPSFSLSHSA